MIKNKSGFLIIFALALIMGLIVSIQLNTSESSDRGGLATYIQVEALEKQLKDVRNEKDLILAEYMELEKRLKEIEEQSISEDAILKAAMADLEKYKMATGIVDMKGPGVIITIDDPLPTEENPGDGYSTIMLRYELLLSLVNKLKESGAEAVSINGQRIIARTEISLAGNNVNINAVPTAPPYIVKAIGDPETLDGALNIRFGIIEDMRSFDLQVSLIKQEEIEISRYNGVIRYIYAKPITSETTAN